MITGVDDALADEVRHYTTSQNLKDAKSAFLEQTILHSITTDTLLSGDAPQPSDEEFWEDGPRPN
ncbi:hypothetical protein HK097_010736, partial [Rhizophlyctis rosea]